MRQRMGKGFHIVTVAGAIVCIVSAAMATTPTLAARHRTSGASPSAISLDQSAPHLGGTVTFTTSAGDLAGWEWPMVYVACSQGSALVYGALDAPGNTFVLGGGSSQWLTNGGAADCTATLYAYGLRGGRETARELASTTFSAAGS